MLSFENLALRRPRNVDVPRLGRDAIAGAISAILQIAYCISFAALIFTGEVRIWHLVVIEGLFGVAEAFFLVVGSHKDG